VETVGSGPFDFAARWTREFDDWDGVVKNGL
jgi:hypothetical protein